MLGSTMTRIKSWRRMNKQLTQPMQWLFSNYIVDLIVSSYIVCPINKLINLKKNNKKKLSLGMVLPMDK